MLKKLLTLCILSLFFLTLVSATDFGYNNLDKPTLSQSSIINYTQVNVNNSIYWGGHAWGVADGLIQNYSDLIPLTDTSAFLVNDSNVNFTSVDIEDNLDVAGNITSTYFKGDGSQLQNVNASPTTPAGDDNQIQFNNGGSFGASANLTWDDAILRVQQIEITDRGVDKNVFVGRVAGRDLTTGINNLGLGDEAMPNIESGSYNTALGGALTQLTTGGGNFGLGHQALRAVTTGANNVGVGTSALYNLVSGHSGNVGIGANGGRGAYGYFNTAIGNDAMYGTSSGHYNVAIGYQSLRTGGAKNDNIAIGAQAGYTLGAGNGNVFIGNEAGKLITGGSNNIFIGNFAGATKKFSVSNILMIDSTDTNTSLIYGDFANDYLTINGKLNVTGNLDVAGNWTGNSYYGGMWYSNNTPTELDFATANQNYTLFMDTSTDLNGFTFTGGFGVESYLTSLVGGKYQANYMATGTGQNNHLYRTSIYINDVGKPECGNGHKMTAGGDIITQSGMCIITINVGDTVKIKTRDVGGTGTGDYYSSNLNLVRIGN